VGLKRGVASAGEISGVPREAGSLGAGVTLIPGVVEGGKDTLVTSTWFRRLTRSSTSLAPWSRLELDGVREETEADVGKS